MSKSYKHNYCIRTISKYNKNRAKRKVRRLENIIPSGNFYKKLYESWNICDYTFREDKADEQVELMRKIKQELNKNCFDEHLTHSEYVALTWQLFGLHGYLKFIHK